MAMEPAGTAIPAALLRCPRLPRKFSSSRAVPRRDGVADGSTHVTADRKYGAWLVLPASGSHRAPGASFPAFGVIRSVRLEPLHVRDQQPPTGSDSGSRGRAGG